jgi:hypothetical protein
MPGFDRTGPMGAGPGSGRGLGPCGAGRRRGFDRGFYRGAWGRGRGRGFGVRPRWGLGPRQFGPFGPRGISASGSPPDELAALREKAAYLRSELEAVHKRLDELEASGS